ALQLLPIQANVNRPSTCNATFNPSGPSVNFYHQTATCVNTGFNSVVRHELGHYWVYVRNLLQGAFGEGLADTAAMMSVGSPWIGPGFYHNGDPVRNPS